MLTVVPWAPGDILVTSGDLAGAGLLPRPPPAPSGTSSLARTLWTQHRHQLLRGMPLPHTPPGLCTSTSEMVFHPITPKARGPQGRSHLSLHPGSCSHWLTTARLHGSAGKGATSDTGAPGLGSPGEGGAPFLSLGGHSEDAGLPPRPGTWTPLGGGKVLRKLARLWPAWREEGSAFPGEVFPAVCPRNGGGGWTRKDVIGEKAVSVLFLI